MDTLPTAPTLGEVLTERIEVVRRLGSEARRPRCHARQRHLEQVIAQSRTSIAGGQEAALKAALLAVDLLSFELCED